MIEGMTVKLREEMLPARVDRGGEAFVRDELCLVRIDGTREIARVVDPAVTWETEERDNGGRNGKMELLRKLTDEDQRVVEHNDELARTARRTCLEKVAAHRLEMKVVRAQYSFDRSKVRFFFTAEGRVDFRDLVKDLAAVLRCRIEMRQVGARDEARILGGYGVCGQQLCCERFLSRFEPVTIKMAKEQNLALNPTKISGICGRLMCCLSYEVENYIRTKRSAPRPGTCIETEQGEAVVTGLNVLRQVLIVEQDGITFEIPLAEIGAGAKSSQTAP